MFTGSIANVGQMDVGRISTDIDDTTPLAFSLKIALEIL